jgi:tetratricopeptide (TPR) repeat protein
LGILELGMREISAAKQSLAEAVSLRRNLFQENSVVYGQYLADALLNLANVHRGLRQFEDAYSNYDEALSLYRGLSVLNPDAHKPKVALTLNNQAACCVDMSDLQNARTRCDEAAEICEPLWRLDQNLFGDQMARIWYTSAEVGMRMGRSRTWVCSTATRAFSAARDQEFKRELLQMVNHVCEGARR